MKYLVVFLLSLCLIATGGCSKKKGCTDPTASNYNSDAEEDDGSCKAKSFNLSQAMLDTTTKLLQYEITGYNEQENGAHGGGGNSIRDIFSNRAATENITEGQSVFVSRAYYPKSTGGRDSINGFNYVMFKREAGYFTEGGDYEYFVIPFKPNINLAQNPNGLVLLASEHGRLATCAGCHAAAQGDDFIFSK